MEDVLHLNVFLLILIFLGNKNLNTRYHYPFHNSLQPREIKYANKLKVKINSIDR